MTSITPEGFSKVSAPFHGIDGIYKRISLIRSISATLGWDEQTYMPPGAAEFRGKQLSYLAEEAHELLTCDRLGTWLDSAEVYGDMAGLNVLPAPYIAEVQRERNRAMALSRKFVGQLAEVTTAAFHAWQKARAEEDFAAYLPHLQEVLTLKREEASKVAQVIRPGRSLPLYEALLDEFEPGMETSAVEQLFGELRQPLTELLNEAEDRRKASGERPNPLRGQYGAQGQQRLMGTVLTAIGFDGQAGRLDTSTHPFCTRVGPKDTRITTRYDEEDLGDGLFSVLHEMGHALYEQGLPSKWWGTPLGDSVSLGIHESQSRLWENFIGRSEPFWRWLLPRVQAEFHGAGGNCGLVEWMTAIHEVRRSYIRVDADEVSYNLHVLLRFDIEKRLVEGTLEARELPEAWNALQQELLGLPPKGDRLGCLQDVHWSGGAFGYFPTYTLGNVQAACLMVAIRRDLPDMDDQLARGEFQPLLKWLRSHIHKQGRNLSAIELMKEATGAEVTASPLLAHLKDKVRTYA